VGCFAECLSLHFTPFNPTQAEYASTYHEGSESHFESITATYITFLVTFWPVVT